MTILLRFRRILPVLCEECISTRFRQHIIPPKAKNGIARIRVMQIRDENITTPEQIQDYIKKEVSDILREYIRDTEMREIFEYLSTISLLMATAWNDPDNEKPRLFKSISSYREYLKKSNFNKQTLIKLIDLWPLLLLSAAPKQ